MASRILNTSDDHLKTGFYQKYQLGIIQIVVHYAWIHVFDRNVWFANFLYCIKRWVIGQYASGYIDCRLFQEL